IVMHANGSLPVIPLYLPVPPVMMWVPQFICGWDLSRSRVSNVEKILSPSASANTHAPSIYFLGPDSTFNATHRADILSSIFSPFMFWVVPTASSVVALPRPGISRLVNGRKRLNDCIGDIAAGTLQVAPAIPPSTCSQQHR